MTFRSAYHHGFARVAACSPRTAVADPAANAEALLVSARACHDDGVAVAVFPELGLSGYAIDDLLLQDALLDAVEAALQQVVEASAQLLPVLVVGAPLRHGNRLVNAAVVVHKGQVLGVAPKSYLPNYREFYERRHFQPGDDLRGEIVVAGASVPLGPDLLFAAEDVPGLVLHVEVCEDLWVPVPPSALAALAGATVLANLSSSPVTVGRAAHRELLVRSASARCIAAYVYAAAGDGESTNDLAWDGQTLVHENGVPLDAAERFVEGGGARAVADVDLGLLRSLRQHNGSFDDNRRTLLDGRAPFRRIGFRLDPPTGDIGLRRVVERFPFVPADADRLEQDCYEAYNIQVAGLVQRLRAIGGPKAVIGVSGGLDSTQAMLVAAKAMDRLGRPRSDVLAYTMPGFATGETSKSAALRLATALGATVEVLDIRPAAEQMLRDLHHPYADGERGDDVYDVTFENVQAGLRYDYLFRLANHRGGIVVGTGDLSEMALGWSTYGVGDQMSHYNVNAGVPKTLIQHLIRWVVASGQFDDDVALVLTEVLAAEISPELVPGRDGVVQSSEAKVGPYELQDFTLFHVVRDGALPSKIAFMALHAWADVEAGRWPPNFPDDKRHAYTLEQIRHWLDVFVRRFFGFSQFKRTAVPNGPKVVDGGALSPRGDWRAPSDSSPQAWLDDLESVPRV
ncbi:NAD(+) synthase [Angustibacter aerolatus]